MTKILLSGYFGFGNLGDEAILASAIHMLKQHFGAGTEFIVLSADPERTKELYNVESANRWDFTEIRKAISAADIVISGGGGLLQDETSTRSVLYYLIILLLGNLLGKETYVFAQGIGPLRTFAGRAACRNILHRVDGILVRDAGSAEELENIGISRERVLEGRDLVLGLPEYKRNPAPGMKRAKAPVVGISVRDFWGFEKIAKDLAEIADYIVHELGGETVFLLMHEEMDRIPTQQVRALMKAESTVVGGDFTYGDMLDVIGTLDLVVGVRLHALIFSMIKRIPHIGIAYSPKVSSFMSETQLPCFEIPLEVNMLKDAICDMLNERDIFEKKTSNSLEKQRDKLYKGVEDLFIRSKFKRLVEKIM